jgi:hypothetical protein
MKIPHFSAKFSGKNPLQLAVSLAVSNGIFYGLHDFYLFIACWPVDPSGEARNYGYQIFNELLLEIPKLFGIHDFNPAAVRAEEGFQIFKAEARKPVFAWY